MLFLFLNLKSMSERVGVRASFGIGLSIGDYVVGYVFLSLCGGWRGGISISDIYQAIAIPQSY